MSQPRSLLHICTALSTFLTYVVEDPPGGISTCQLAPLWAGAWMVSLKRSPEHSPLLMEQL